MRTPESAEQEVTWRFVYPHHLAHDETDKQVYEAEWLANSLEQLLAAERRAYTALEARLASAEAIASLRLTQMEQGYDVMARLEQRADAAVESMMHHYNLWLKTDDQRLAAEAALKTANERADSWQETAEKVVAMGGDYADLEAALKTATERADKAEQERDEARAERHVIAMKHAGAAKGRLAWIWEQMHATEDQWAPAVGYGGGESRRTVEGAFFQSYAQLATERAFTADLLAALRGLAGRAGSEDEDEAHEAALALIAQAEQHLPPGVDDERS